MWELLIQRDWNLLKKTLGDRCSIDWRGLGMDTKQNNFRSYKYQVKVLAGQLPLKALTHRWSLSTNRHVSFSLCIVPDSGGDQLSRIRLNWVHWTVVPSLKAPSSFGHEAIVKVSAEELAFVGSPTTAVLNLILTGPFWTLGVRRATLRVACVALPRPSSLQALSCSSSSSASFCFTIFSLPTQAVASSLLPNYDRRPITLWWKSVKISCA